MARILIADDDADLVASLCGGLRCEGYAVEAVANGDDAVVAATAGRFDVVILDIQMPGMNGYRVLRHLRSAGVWTPVLMLTAKDGEYDEAEGLDAGADDYLTKPFSYVVLLARLRLLLRRDDRPRPTVRVAGGLTVDLVARTVSRDGVAISLTVKEFELLATLTRSPGHPVSRAAIAAALWDDPDVSPNVIEAHVSGLRKKVDAPFGTSSVQTLRGYGYRITTR